MGIRCCRQNSQLPSSPFGIMICAYLLTFCFVRQVASVNCPTSPGSLSQLCLNPSIGPTGGGSTITVKGFQNPDGQTWGVYCLFVESWSCVFAIGGSQSFKSEGFATSADCIAGQIRCIAPAVSQPNDYIFYVSATSITSGKSSSIIYPSSGSLPQFSYFGELTGLTFWLELYCL